MLCVHQSQRFQVLVIQLLCTTLVHFDCGPAETYPICVMTPQWLCSTGRPKLASESAPDSAGGDFFFCQGFFVEAKRKRRIGNLEITWNHSKWSNSNTLIAFVWGILRCHFDVGIWDNRVLGSLVSYYWRLQRIHPNLACFPCKNHITPERYGFEQNVSFEIHAPFEK